jgi:DNA-binding GntR family transcriptional regulator
VKNGKSTLYDDLKRQILTMELNPDEALDEVAISERYGLSRTPVREVFRRLAGEGYIDIRENRGARVIPMNHSTLRNFFLVAPMVYAAIGRLAVQNLKGHQRVVFKEKPHPVRAAAGSRVARMFVGVKHRVPAIMGEMSGNQYLEPSLERLLIDHARIGHTFFRPRDEDTEQRLQLSAEHHDSFIEAIENRDESAVVDLVFEHWELSRENMEIFIAPHGIKADLPFLLK